MDIGFLNEYFVPVIAGVCLCTGFVIKSIESVENRYIPGMNALLGLVLALWIYWGEVTPQVVLSGLFSGLASTGLYEAFDNLIGG